LDIGNYNQFYPVCSDAMWSGINLTIFLEMSGNYYYIKHHNVPEDDILLNKFK